MSVTREHFQKRRLLLFLASSLARHLCRRLLESGRQPSRDDYAAFISRIIAEQALTYQASVPVHQTSRSVPDSAFISRALTEQDLRNQVSEAIYDPDFEDPCLFKYLAEDIQARAELPPRPSIDDTLTSNPDNDYVEKHTWPCVVCLEKPPETLFLPCFHAVCCRECGDQVGQSVGCPVCSSRVDSVSRIFFTQNTCVVCMDRPPEAVFKPCCHTVCCESCTKVILGVNVDEDDYDDDIQGKCPVCKAEIEEAHAFLLAYS